MNFGHMTNDWKQETIAKDIQILIQIRLNKQQIIMNNAEDLKVDVTSTQICKRNQTREEQETNYSAHFTHSCTISDKTRNLWAGDTATKQFQRESQLVDFSAALWTSEF